jgi:glucose-6-phosphate 1-dehydrogenase
VIFGGSGDLAHRKLLPALYNLHVDRLLPPKAAVVGVGRKEMSDDDYRAFAKDGVTQFSRRPIDERRGRRSPDAVLRQHVARRRAWVRDARGAAGQRGARPEG